MLSKEKIIMVKKTTCQVKLQNHKWMILFTYHGKEECFKVEEFLEDKRKQDFRNYLNGASGSRA